MGDRDWAIGGQSEAEMSREMGCNAPTQRGMSDRANPVTSRKGGPRTKAGPKWEDEEFLGSTPTCKRSMSKRVGDIDAEKGWKPGFERYYDMCNHQENHNYKGGLGGSNWAVGTRIYSAGRYRRMVSPLLSESAPLSKSEERGETGTTMGVTGTAHWMDGSAYGK